ncbi:regulator of chromosome condensation 1/beta-lactamase-inhibitor protein II [Xylariaceae sp. FL0662B]|nr:regulator of chromosome condensation 1/beta-lactamase-inhibitor protein II [Xylariaceae sp. FL0662B]
MPSASASRTRKTKDREHRSNAASRNIAPRIKKTVQNRSIDSAKQNNAASVASRRTQKRKHPLDQVFTTTPLEVSKRRKTSSATSRVRFRDDQPTKSRSAIINRVPRHAYNADSEDEDEDADLNPLESSPIETPTDCFPPNVRFVQVAAGDNCSFALTDTGLVYGWGTFRLSHYFAQSETDPDIIKLAGLTGRQRFQLLIRQAIFGPGAVMSNTNSGGVFLDAIQTLWPHVRSESVATKLNTLHLDVITPLRLIGDDNVWAWGVNSFGEAGDARTADGNSAFVTPTKIRSLCKKQVLVLDGGLRHSAAVTANGECLVWGHIDNGQLGIAFTPEQIQDSTLIRCDNRNKPRICLRPTAIPTIQKVGYVACGSDHTILIDQSGNAYATGYDF